MRSPTLSTLLCALLLFGCGDDPLTAIESGDLKPETPFAPPPEDPEDPEPEPEPTEPDPEPTDPDPDPEPEPPPEPDPPNDPDPIDPVEPGAPIPAWSVDIGGAGADEIRAVTVDAAGNVTIAGFFRKTFTLGGVTYTAQGDQDEVVQPADIFIASYDTNGIHRWSHTFGTEGHDEPTELTVDDEGNVTLIGTQQGAIDFGGGPVSSPQGASSEVFVVSFTASGVHRWSRAFGGPGMDLGRGVAPAPDGGVCIVGQYDGVLLMDGHSVEAVYALDGFVSCLNASGQARWVRSLGGFYMDGMWGVAVAPDGTVFVSGEYDADSGDVTADGVPLGGSGWETYLAVYTPDGTLAHVQPYGSSGADGTKGVGVDASGNVFLGGLYGAAIDFGGGPLPYTGAHEGFVASFDGSYAHRWSVGFGEEGFDQVLDLTMSPDDDVVIVGRYDGTLTVAETPLASDGDYDLFVASYAADGAARWAVSVGGVGAEQAMGVAAGPNGEVYLVGSFGENMSHGEQLLVSAGSADGFLLKFEPPAP